MRFKDFLTEMSFYATDAEGKITSIIPKLIEHLVKFWYCEDRTPEKHWLNEIRKFANIILNANDTKPDRKPFSYKKCLKMFATVYDDYKLKSDIETIRGEYNLVDFDDPRAYKNIQKLFDDMWKKMSERKFDMAKFIAKVEKLK